MVCLCFARVGFLRLFFFKKKTAYEMRISDWSSDVFSSDLTIYALAGNDVIDGGAGADYMDGGAGNDSFYVDTWSDDGFAGNDDQVIEQNGRESCRERVR